MDAFAAGHCHTYNPQETSPAGRQGQFYAHLGKVSNSLKEFYIGYNIYLHEVGQFWPGIDRRGQIELIHLGAKTQWEGSFTVRQKTSINRDHFPCVEDPGYSYTSCMFNYISTVAGCHLDWFSSADLPNDLPRCSTREEIFKYSNKLMWACTTAFTKLSAESGCQPRCLVRKFHFAKRPLEQLKWRKRWSSAIFIHAKITALEINDEYWDFDIADTLNGIGGVMGLFLGWSLYLILYKTYLLVQRAMCNIFFNT